MASYTPDEFGRLTDRFAKGLPRALAEAALVAAQGLTADIPQRIFQDGKDADGGAIGSYSTTPTLVGASSFTNKTVARQVFGSKAKRAKLDWVKVKGRNLAVLPGGYKEIRRLSDLRTDTVDLSFHGDLEKSIKLVQKKKSFDIIIKGKENVAKARANERRFSADVFEASKKEEKKARDTYNDEINKYLNKFFD